MESDKLPSNNKNIMKYVLFLLILLFIFLCIRFWNSIAIVRYLLIIVLFFLILWGINRYKMMATLDRVPSWVKRSMKFSLYAVVALFVFMLAVALIGAYKSNFSCTTCMFFGLCAGGHSLGACFAWPTIMFLLAAVPAAVVGAVVGFIVDMILFFIHKSKEK